MKYELFCKWLQQNNYNALSIEGFHVENPLMHTASMTTTSGIILTEDEVSSFATNTDVDSDSDVFVDTETDFPAIVLTNTENDENLLQIDGEQTNLPRADTPSQLSVSDYDCGASDTTINSNFSTASDQSKKRKAKHNKGRAPAIPLNKTSSTENIRIVRETDIWPT